MPSFIDNTLSKRKINILTSFNPNKTYVHDMDQPETDPNHKIINDYAQQSRDNDQALGSRSLPGKWKNIWKG